MTPEGRLASALAHTVVISEKENSTRVTFEQSIHEVGDVSMSITSGPLFVSVIVDVETARRISLELNHAIEQAEKEAKETDS